MTDVNALTHDLAAVAPAVAALLREHRAEYDGDVLAHVFVADVTRWLAANGPDAAVLGALERHLAGGDAEVRNVIALSFLENLEPGDEPVRAALGPRLRAELAAMERWHAEDRDPAT
jgi:hypothetical protein